MNIERRYLPSRAEASEAGIHGLAAVFYREEDSGTEYRLWENAVERIMPGAFDRAVQDDDVRALFNHDPSQILGRTKAGTLRLSVDEQGLRYDVEPSEIRMYQDVLNMLKRGDIDGSSFSFVVTRETWLKEGDKEIRQVEDLELYDVGPVTYPAYAATQAWARAEDFARRSHDLWVEHIERQKEQIRRERVAMEKALREAKIRQLTYSI